MQKIINFFNNVLLINFFIFLVFTPFFSNLFLKVCLYLAIFWWIILGVLRYKGKFYRGLVLSNPLNKYFLFFGLSCLISILFSSDPYHSQSIFFERFLYFAIFFWIGNRLVANSKKNLYFLVFSFILAGFIIGFGGVRDFIYYMRVARGLAIRLWSVFQIRIPYYGLPLYLTYFIPFNFAIFIFGKHKFFKIVGFINFIFLFFCLICNGSRMGIFAVLVSLLFISFIKNRKVITLAIFSLILTLTLIINFISGSPDLQWRLKTMFTPSEWSYRLPLWKSAISIFYDHPIVGCGLGMLEKTLHTPNYELSKDYPIPKEWVLHAHNTYLEVAAEMGIIGILTFLLIFVAFFKKAIRLIKLPRGDIPQDEQAIFLGLVGTILAILIFAFSTTILTVGLTVSSYFWFLFGMAAGLLKKGEAEISS